MTTLSEAIARFEEGLKLEIADTYQSVDEINHTNGWVNGYVEAYNKAMPIIRQQQRMIDGAIEWLNGVSYLLPVEDCIKILSANAALETTMPCSGGCGKQLPYRPGTDEATCSECVGRGK